jgi:hypothetical protein
MVHISKAFGIVKSHKKRSDQPWSYGYGDSVQITLFETRSGKGFLNHGNNIPDVFPGGEFRDNTSIRMMDLNL